LGISSWGILSLVDFVMGAFVMGDFVMGDFVVDSNAIYISVILQMLALT